VGSAILLDLERFVSRQGGKVVTMTKRSRRNLILIAIGVICPLLFLFGAAHTGNPPSGYWGKPLLVFAGFGFFVAGPIGFAAMCVVLRSFLKTGREQGKKYHKARLIGILTLLLLNFCTIFPHLFYVFQIFLL
jgi:hypothetical protein